MGDSVLGFWRKKSVVIALVFIIIVASVFGYSYYAGVIRWEAPKVERLMVGVMTLRGPILSSQNVSQYADIINRAKVNESIRAVVLSVDSPGGYADFTEMIYLDLLELKKEKPLVASIVSALSGGYYIAVAADHIYAGPTSAVGNIGLIGTGPPTLIPSEHVPGDRRLQGDRLLKAPLPIQHEPCPGELRLSRREREGRPPQALPNPAPKRHDLLGERSSGGGIG